MWRILSAIGGLALLCDRLTKWCFVSHQDAHISVLEPYLYLEYHLNTQLALSIPLISWLYYPLLVGVILVLCWTWYKAIRDKMKWDTLIITFVLVGALSNLADRIIYGGVIDFIVVSFWSVFNVADMYIVGGVLVWMVLLWQRDKKAS